MPEGSDVDRDQIIEQMTARQRTPMLVAVSSALEGSARSSHTVVEEIGVVEKTTAAARAMARAVAAAALPDHAPTTAPISLTAPPPQPFEI